MTDALPTDSIALLFEADPTSLSDADLLTLIHELRRRRNVFLSEEAAASLKAKKTRATPEPSTPARAAALDKPASEIDLEDLVG